MQTGDTLPLITLPDSTLIFQPHRARFMYWDFEMPNSPLGPVSSVGEPLQAGDVSLLWPGSDYKTIRYDGSEYIF